jgi:hypothetical protein
MEELLNKLEKLIEVPNVDKDPIKAINALTMLYIIVQIRAEVKKLGLFEVRQPLLLTNQKLLEMAKVITEKQKAAKVEPTDKVDWDMLEELWFDWLKEELFGNDA